MQTSFQQDRAWAEVRLDALRHNVIELSRLLPASCEFKAVIKADAYGHGMVPLGLELNRLGVRSFCVATVSEGAELRQAGVTGEILVLGRTHPRLFNRLVENHLIQAVVDREDAQNLEASGLPLRVHLKLDTGMRRLGQRSEDEAMADILSVFACKNLSVEGVFTHLCVSDGVTAKDQQFTRGQIAAFDRTVDGLPTHLRANLQRHVQASYGVMNYRDLHYEAARLGIALYGAAPCEASDTIPADVNLQPLLSLKARVVALQKLHRGEGVGYGLRYIAPDERQLAVLGIGYGDGLRRNLSKGVGSVLLHGCRAPIVGTVCMDLTFVDVTDIPHVQIGDVAVLIGTEGDKTITAADMATALGTISYEVLCGLNPRVRRVYRES